MTVELLLPPNIVERMKVVLHRAGEREIGGVLMARQIVPGAFEIADFSVDEVSGRRMDFVRDHSYHNKFLEAFFERTGRDYMTYNYIGEWHSHPRLPTSPSATDLESMESLVEEERDIPFAVLLVVRSDVTSEFSAFATFHRRGAPPELVRVITAG